jgi:hypothetical protein
MKNPPVATLQAEALVTASLLGDRAVIQTCLPHDPMEAECVSIALGRLCARMIKMLAKERGQDPVEMWQKVMLNKATHPSEY